MTERDGEAPAESRGSEGVPIAELRARVRPYCPV